MPRQLDFGNSILPEATDKAEDNGWEPVRNKKKSRRTLSVQPTTAVARPTKINKMIWREGMILGVGRPLPGGKEARASLTAFRGMGSMAEPHVCWNGPIEAYDKNMVGDCETLVRTEARRLNCTLVVIRYCLSL